MRSSQMLVSTGSQPMLFCKFSCFRSLVQTGHVPKAQRAISQPDLVLWASGKAIFFSTHASGVPSQSTDTPHFTQVAPPSHPEGCYYLTSQVGKSSQRVIREQDTQTSPGVLNCSVASMPGLESFCDTHFQNAPVKSTQSPHKKMVLVFFTYPFFMSSKSPSKDA